MSESHHQHFKIVLFGCVYIVNSCCSLLMNATSAVNILDNDVDCTYFTTHFSIHHQTTIHCELVKSYWAILTSLITDLDVFCCTCTFHFCLKLTLEFQGSYKLWNDMLFFHSNRLLLLQNK